MLQVDLFIFALTNTRWGIVGDECHFYF